MPRAIAIASTMLLLLTSAAHAEPAIESTVRGRLTDYHGHPIPGARVIIAGQNVITGRDGYFVANDVPSTYDLIYVGPPVIAYRGLSLRSPAILGMSSQVAETSRNLLAGRVPIIEEEYTRIIVTAPGLFAGTSTDDQGLFKLQSRSVLREGVLEATVFALRNGWIESQVGVRIPQFTALASRQVAIQPGATTVLEFGPEDFHRSTEFRIRGRVLHPTEYTLNGVGVHLEYDEARIALYGASARPMPDQFDLPAPFLPGVTYGIVASATRKFPGTPPIVTSPHNALVAGLTPPVGGLTLEFHAAPEIILPSQGATAVESTARFSWTESPGPGIYELTITPTRWQGPGMGGRYKWRVYVAGTTATMDDLPSVDPVPNRTSQGLVPGQQHVCVVRKLHSLHSIDDAATAMMRDASGNVTTSVSHMFTVRPK